MSNLYRGPSIDASYQVSVHMVEGFQRRRLKCEKLTDDRRWTPSDGKSSRYLWQGELKIQIQIHSKIVNFIVKSVTQFRLYKYCSNSKCLLPTT